MKNYSKQIHTPGILGGMGPHAHIILEEYLLEINAKKYIQIAKEKHKENDLEDAFTVHESILTKLSIK